MSTEVFATKQVAAIADTNWPKRTFGVRSCNQANASLKDLTPGHPLVYNPRYPGQYFDEETGLLQNYFRSYQAAQGRYTQADPIGLEGGLNRFGYVGGNPLMYTDPLGLKGLMPGGNFGDTSVTDNGSSCEPLLSPPRVDDNGCISTGGGPSICFGPGAIRSVATNLAEQMAMQAARDGLGTRIIQGLINDPKYPESVWAKMQVVNYSAEAKNVVVHYWQNLVTGAREGFKFK